jgi:hypothetical protein
MAVGALPLLHPSSLLPPLALQSLVLALLLHR